MTRTGTLFAKAIREFDRTHYAAEIRNIFLQDATGFFGFRRDVNIKIEYVDAFGTYREIFYKVEKNAYSRNGVTITKRN